MDRGCFALPVRQRRRIRLRHDIDESRAPIAAREQFTFGDGVRVAEFDREQESIVIDRRQLASDRRAAREGGDNGDFTLRQQSLDDRQRALNDSRSLESAREQAMDAMRHYFLLNCGVGRDRLD